MKKMILLITALICTYPVFSQKDSSENKQPDSKQETLITMDNLTIGVYGGPEFKFTNINGEMGFMSGGRGGLVIGRVFTIGGGGYGLTTNHKVKVPSSVVPTNYNEYYLDAGWGGLFMEFVSQPNDLVHFSVNSMIGGGKAFYYEKKYYNNWDENDIDRSTFFYFEPGINAEINVATFLRLSIGGSYRLIAGLNMKGLENKDLGGYSVNAMLKFGLDDFNVLNKIIDDVKKTIDE